MAKKNNDQVMVSDFNLEKISTKEMEDHIRHSIRMDSNISFFGRRGSGKTEICKQAIRAENMKEVYLNLSVLERVDMGGYPDVLNPNRKKDFIDFILPAFYEDMINPEAKQGVVALLDEVDKADPSLWAPLLEFVQFRSINGVKLPNLKCVLMTGNLMAEGGNRPSLPLLDRSEKYLVGADHQAWLEWAGRSGNIHPSVVAYITDHPGDLFGEVDPGDRYADPSPRGWTAASDLLRKGEVAKLSADVLNKKVAGRVGKQSGLKYAHYYEHYQQLLPLVAELYEGKDILKKYNKLEPTKKIVAGIIIGTRIANKLDATPDTTPVNKLPKEVSLVGKFFSSIGHEEAYIVLRNQLTVHRLAAFNLDEHPDWSKLIEGINNRFE